MDMHSGIEVFSKQPAAAQSTQLPCDSSLPGTSSGVCAHNYLICQSTMTAHKTRCHRSGHSMHDANHNRRRPSKMPKMPSTVVVVTPQDGISGGDSSATTTTTTTTMTAANRIEPCNEPCDSCSYYSLAPLSPSSMFPWFGNARSSSWSSLLAKQLMPSMHRAVRSIDTLKYILFILLICHCHDLAQ